MMRKYQNPDAGHKRSSFTEVPDVKSATQANHPFLAVFKRQDLTRIPRSFTAINGNHEQPWAQQSYKMLKT